MMAILSRVDQLLSDRLPFVSSILKGIGQIMLQENSITGIFFLVGIFIGSFDMGIATIVSVISGTITAKLLKYDSKEISAGLYGFSPALIGVALILFYKPQVIVWIVIIISSVLAAIIQHYFIKRRIPVFTLPFVLLTWIAIYVFNNIIQITPSIILDDNGLGIRGYSFAFKGIGQVIFQDKLIVGILFFIGILLNSHISALYALLGSTLSGIMALILSMPSDVVYLGLFSYNAVLCAIVFAENKKTDVFIWSFLSIILSLIIAVFMFKMQLIQLTFPFVSATLITIIIKNRYPRKFDDF